MDCTAVIALFKDVPESADDFRKAARLGDEGARLNLGTMRRGSRRAGLRRIGVLTTDGGEDVGVAWEGVSVPAPGDGRGPTPASPTRRFGARYYCGHGVGRRSRAHP